jgi:transcriptional regulator with XRE-family HTH domain
MGLTVEERRNASRHFKAWITYFLQHEDSRQKVLARALGISPSALSQLRSVELRLPDAETLMAMRKLFSSGVVKISLDMFLYSDPPGATSDPQPRQSLAYPPHEASPSARPGRRNQGGTQ